MVKGFLPPIVEACLPYKIISAIGEKFESDLLDPVGLSEIRLRSLRKASVTYMAENIVIGIELCDKELRECVTKLCGGSVYAHSDTIRQGYIKAGSGVRVGVCGSLAPDGRGVYEITSLNIRIPHIVKDVSRQAIGLCLADGRVRSTLIYSPPGEGKTTMLRDISAKLGGEHCLRAAVIDSRSEIFIPEMFGGTLCDFLDGYSKAEGIEIATRTLSPQAIICDELGNMDETKSILLGAGAGVPIIATAHAGEIRELLTRPNIKPLHEGGIFEGYMKISRERIGGRVTRNFIIEYTPRHEAEGYL